MSWLILSLLALITFVAYDVAGRYFATRSENPQAFATIYNTTVAVIAPLLFIFDRTLPSNLTPKVIFLTIIGLILWGLNGRYEYFAKKHVEASVFTITMKLAPVVNFFLAVIFLKEQLTVAKMGGIILIVIANLLLYIGNQGKIISRQGLYYTLLLALIISFAWLFDAINVRYWGVAPFSIVSFAVGGIISGIFPLVKIKEIRRELELTPIWQFAILGFFNLVGYAFMIKALTLGPASNVIPIVTSTTPLVVLIGVVFLGERDSLARKIFASVLVLIAIYLMR